MSNLKNKSNDNIQNENSPINIRKNENLELSSSRSKNSDKENQKILILNQSLHKTSNRNNRNELDIVNQNRNNLDEEKNSNNDILNSRYDNNIDNVKLKSANYKKIYLLILNGSIGFFFMGYHLCVFNSIQDNMTKVLK